MSLGWRLFILLTPALKAENLIIYFDLHEIVVA